MKRGPASEAALVARAVSIIHQEPSQQVPTPPSWYKLHGATLISVGLHRGYLMEPDTVTVTVTQPVTLNCDSHVTGDLLLISGGLYLI